jgi:hypothetical protein
VVETGDVIAKDPLDGACETAMRIRKPESAAIQRSDGSLRL